MAGRRPPLTRRLLHGVVDVVSDRAPWVTDQAYRMVATPLQWVDPAGGARMAEARLDQIRERVATMAARGRVSRAELRRIRRDVARTREDLERLTPRLPAVQARTLTLRLAAYADAVEALPGGTVTARGAGVRAREAVAATGVAAGAGMAVLLPTAGTVAVQGGLAAGVVTAVGVTAARQRRARKERLTALAQSLTRVDDATRAPSGVPVGDVDRDRRVLTQRALASGRLDERGAATLRAIDRHLEDLLVRLVDGDLDADVSFLVTATVTSYLPDTLGPLLALADPHTVVRGRPAAMEVADQLASIESALSAARQRPARNHPENLLLLQGDFLRDKFGDTPGGTREPGRNVPE